MLVWLCRVRHKLGGFQHKSRWGRGTWPACTSMVACCVVCVTQPSRRSPARCSLLCLCAAFLVQSLDGVFAHSLTTLLTGSQIAAACVASYPYLPRWHAMMSALKQRKEDEAQQQLQALQVRQTAALLPASLACIGICMALCLRACGTQCGQVLDTTPLSVNSFALVVMVQSLCVALWY